MNYTVDYAIGFLCGMAFMFMLRILDYHVSRKEAVEDRHE